MQSSERRLQALRGMRDILPDEIPRWQRVEATLAEWMQRYGYREIRTPIVESAELFYRGVGQETDAIGKEMYVFPDRSGELIALRPELTAPVARAVGQHELALASPLLRLWYYGPCFRYERPQKGRQRQFHQAGAECLGVALPDADVEIISLAWDILTSLLDHPAVSLHINTLGTVAEQNNYRTRLVEYLERYRDSLSTTSQQRLDTNPLRILDSKDTRDREIIEAAPRISDVLSTESRSHFDAVLELLDMLDIPTITDPYLVRGLDYYTHTVFEFRSNRLGAQDALGGGGRYDNLMAQVGGRPLPGVGFGLGIERIILAMEDRAASDSHWEPIVYVAAQQEFSAAMHQVTRSLRKEGIRCITDLQFRSLKAQLRQADRLRCALCLIIGWSAPVDSVIIKDMRNGEQLQLPNDPNAISATIRQLLAQ